MEPKTYKGVKRKDLPTFDSEIHGWHYVFKEYDGSHVPEWARTYVRYTRWWDTSTTDVGFFISKDAERHITLMRKLDYLLKNGGYEFRRTPLYGMGGYKNSIHAVRAKGAMAEHNHNLMCKDELEAEYGVLVRMKRAQVTRDNATDYDHPYGYNSQRGWKRSKKRKQWM